MPIYEYECGSCHNEIEVIQKPSDDALRECPHCHESALSKKLSLNSFQLKGNGWYKDGYGTAKNESDKKNAKSEKPSKKSEAA